MSMAAVVVIKNSTENKTASILILSDTVFEPQASDRPRPVAYATTRGDRLTYLTIS